jgi:hypothetical protein
MSVRAQFTCRPGSRLPLGAVRGSCRFLIEARSRGERLCGDGPNAILSQWPVTLELVAVYAGQQDSDAPGDVSTDSARVVRDDHPRPASRSRMTFTVSPGRSCGRNALLSQNAHQHFECGRHEFEHWPDGGGPALGSAYHCSRLHRRRSVATRSG